MALWAFGNPNLSILHPEFHYPRFMYTPFGRSGHIEGPMREPKAVDPLQSSCLVLLSSGYTLIKSTPDIGWWGCVRKRGKTKNHREAWLIASAPLLCHKTLILVDHILGARFRGATDRFHTHRVMSLRRQHFLLRLDMQYFYYSVRHDVVVVKQRSSFLYDCINLFVVYN